MDMSASTERAGQTARDRPLATDGDCPLPFRAAVPHPEMPELELEPLRDSVVQGRWQASVIAVIRIPAVRPEQRPCASRRP